MELKHIFAKDCPLTLAKSRLALGSPGWLVGWLFCWSSPSRKWLNTQTNSCWIRPVQPSTPQYSLLQPTTAQFSLVQTSTDQYSPAQHSIAQCSTVQSTTAHHHQCTTSAGESIPPCIHLYTVQTVFFTEAPWSCSNSFWSLVLWIQWCNGYEI